MTKNAATRTSSGCELMKFAASLKTSPTLAKMSPPPPPTFGAPPPPTWPAGPLLIPPPYSTMRGSSHRAQAPGERPRGRKSSALEPEQLVRGVARDPGVVPVQRHGRREVDGELVDHHP